jgi:hypothetical protein
LEQTTNKGGMGYLIISIICFIGAIITFLPYKNIDDECMLGYKALCAFTPVSSLILIVVGIFLLFIRKKMMKSA